MIPDTNILVRAFIRDNEAQTEAAQELLRRAEHIHISTVALCEFVWALRQVYKKTRLDVVNAIGLLVADERVITDRAALEAGLAFLSAGCDFADGVIEFQGRRLGGEVFVTFDRKAAAAASSQGRRSIFLDTQ
ncbi:type II toxin-antitoxin system VapC family toxin [Neorhizobium sp. NCHU2750]|uniref:type II toxin-antitoxin system VapC family toxin n=1 Tax=Neorhizobium sp. NCHU2750 TaxID=1825976 RepID=UPI000E7205A4|nr:DNA-binding protein [Neorhizobium sp. NCHU2750]